MNNLFGNMQQFMTQYQQFRSQMSKDTDPNQMIQSMMNQGRVSQQQYNYASNLANQISQMFIPHK